MQAGLAFQAGCGGPSPVLTGGRPSRPLQSVVLSSHLVLVGQHLSGIKARLLGSLFPEGPHASGCLVPGDECPFGSIWPSPCFHRHRGKPPETLIFYWSVENILELIRFLEYPIVGPRLFYTLRVSSATLILRENPFYFLSSSTYHKVLFCGELKLSM